MQLIVMLLATVSILTFLSGAIVFFGATKGDRVRSAWYFAAAIFATVWMASISIFLVARPEQSNTINWHVIWTFVSAILIDVAFLGYGAWKKRYGKITTFIFLVLGLYLKASSLDITLSSLYFSFDSLSFISSNNSLLFNIIFRT